MFGANKSRHDSKNMPSTEPNSPALRISHIVRGRERVGHRVKYLVDPEGVLSETAVPETVVLRRWRQRERAGFRFGGDRLSSTLWRAMRYVFNESPAQVCSMSREEIAVRLEDWRVELRRRRLSLPSPMALRVLLSAIGPERLALMLARHADPKRSGHSGVPDLFLYALEAETDRCAYVRFVEVKRPRELLSQDQLDELEFLRALGLPARVLRLREQG